MKLPIYPETCESWPPKFDIVHNHIDCPYCAQQYAPTDMYHDLRDVAVGFILACKACGTKFKLIERNGLDILKWEWEKMP